ncbi:chromo domain-containing protein [Cryptosporidium andersoni]|uniref:Chromo domain-containing protein n=1 Tax=Cryptosporidium andersoni TaxID=117008 RepID=A0A1J4MYW0_9CRYT|nr:chromo domain-containing protein [Cryptosporidium andersoni]
MVTSISESSSLSNIDGGNFDSECKKDVNIPSICDVSLVLKEDPKIPDSTLSYYDIEEEYLGFGLGIRNISESFAGINRNIGYCINKLSVAVSPFDCHSSVRLCYTDLWKRLPRNIPVRDIALSRHHIAVLLNNGHIYVTQSFNNEFVLSGNKVKRSFNNTSSDNEDLCGDILLYNWLHIKELDEKEIRGIKISSTLDSLSISDEISINDLRSFILSGLTGAGNIWITEYSGYTNKILLYPIDLDKLNVLESSYIKKAIDISISELVKNKGEINDTEYITNDKSNLILKDSMHHFPYRYGMAVSCINSRNESFIIIYGSDVNSVIMNIPYPCRKIYCGLDAINGIILLQNGILLSWRKVLKGTTIQNKIYGTISIININDDIDLTRNIDKTIFLSHVKGSLSNKHVVDFSAILGEYIALTKDGLVHEWNDKFRNTLFTRPYIAHPIVWTPVFHYYQMKEYVQSKHVWQFSQDINNSDYDKDDNTFDLSRDPNEITLDSEINNLYLLPASSGRFITCIWLLEGVTIFLYSDNTLKALYNYIGKDGYNTRIGFISNQSNNLKYLNMNKVSSIISSMQWASKLGTYLPANPISLVSILSEYYKGTPKQRNLIIQRSLIKLSLREKPVYRILTSPNVIIFGILRSNPKWRKSIEYNAKIGESQTEINHSVQVNIGSKDNSENKESYDIKRNLQDIYPDKRSYIKDEVIQGSKGIRKSVRLINKVGYIKETDTFTPQSDDIPTESSSQLESPELHENSTYTPGKKRGRPKRSLEELSLQFDKENEQILSNPNFTQEVVDNSAKLYYSKSKSKVNKKDNDNQSKKRPSLLEYEVEQILSVREKPISKQREYLVKWKIPGHPVQPTWEPEEHLQGCEELVDEFNKSIKTSRSGRLLLPCTLNKKI